LDRGLVLPDFNEPGKNAWPPYKVPLGALRCADTDKGTCNLTLPEARS